MSIGTRSAELSADIELLDDDPTAGAAAMSGPSADDGADAEEIAVEDKPPEMAEPVAHGAAEPAMEDAAEPVMEDIAEPAMEDIAALVLEHAVENPPAAEADDSESLAAELNIPEPEDETVIEAAAESAVAEALEDALDSMSEAEKAVAEGAGPDKPDIRSLLKRVEEAARQARTLTRGHAGAGDGEDDAPAADADETTEPPDPDNANAAA